MSTLEARHLVAGYRHGRRTSIVVEVESWALQPGQLTAVIGPNGSGKSTLLRTLIGSQPPISGEVLLDGTDVRHLDRQERARKVAVVLTDRVDPGLLTVGDIVLLGRHPHTGWRGDLTAEDEGHRPCCGGPPRSRRAVAPVVCGAVRRPAPASPRRPGPRPAADRARPRRTHRLPRHRRPRRADADRRRPRPRRAHRDRVDPRPRPRPVPCRPGVARRRWHGHRQPACRPRRRRQRWPRRSSPPITAPTTRPCSRRSSPPSTAPRALDRADVRALPSSWRTGLRPAEISASAAGRCRAERRALPLRRDQSGTAPACGSVGGR